MSESTLLVYSAALIGAAGFVGWQACRLADSMRSVVRPKRRRLRRAPRVRAEWTPVDDDWLDSWGIRP